MTIDEYMYQCFRREGMTAEGACATLAQILHESAFRPNNAEDSKGIPDEVYTQQVDSGARTRQQFMTDGVGYGYAQWTEAGRKSRMYDFHRARGKSIGDSDTQISYLLWEMNNYFPNQWKLVTASHDLEKCVHDLLYYWENPAEKENNMRRRLQDAQNYMKRFSAVEVQEEEKQLTEEEAIQLVLSLAESEIGYHEKASNSQLDDKTANSGSGNWTKYARDIAAIGNFYNGNKNGYAWCDVFVDWLFVKCFGAETGRQMVCQPYNSAGAGCLYSAQYYKQAGRWFTSPQPGDQIFFSYSPGEYSHTGIVKEILSGMAITIEGNSSDAVVQRSYSVGNASIAGYGRPRWELAGTPNVIVPSVSSRILRLGCKGDDVQELQEKLIDLGYDLGSWGADGDFGNDTRNAVEKFQREHNVQPVDGEVGPDTRAAIEKALKEPVKQEEDSDISEIPKAGLHIRMLKPDMEGSDVKLAQAALQCWGYITVVTGIFGKEMEQKVRDFQEKNGIPVSGEVDLQTWKMLLTIE